MRPSARREPVKPAGLDSGDDLVAVHGALDAIAGNEEVAVELRDGR